MRKVGFTKRGPASGFAPSATTILGIRPGEPHDSKSRRMRAPGDPRSGYGTRLQFRSSKDLRTQRINWESPLLLAILGLSGLVAAIGMGQRLGFLGYALGLSIGLRDVRTPLRVSSSLIYSP